MFCAEISCSGAVRLQAVAAIAINGTLPWRRSALFSRNLKSKFSEAGGTHVSIHGFYLRLSVHMFASLAPIRIILAEIGERNPRNEKAFSVPGPINLAI